jgi:hypothetical protein
LAERIRNRIELRAAPLRSSSLGRSPAALAILEEHDLALQGAVLTHGIAEGQIFVDGFTSAPA